MPEDKSRSLHALDALNFCNAGIQTGLGPFISIYYTAVRHWNPGQIGILLACQSLSGIAVQSFVGNWVDESHHKRLLTAVAGIVVALGALCIAILPGFAVQVAVQLVIGLAVTVFPAATSAFALGMVDTDKIPKRIARNEGFTHTGNVVFAIAAGALGTLLALQGIFYAAALFALGMAPAALLIQGNQVSYEAARGGKESKEGEQAERSGFRDLLTDKRILTFTVAVVLFYFANAATLPIVGEILTQGKKGHQSAWQIAAAVVVAETVMIVVAIWAGKLADSWGRKPLFLIGFAVLALRNALTVVNHNEFYLISLQALDGIAMGLYGVLLSLVTADLAKGTGRFNLLQGAVQSSMGLGGMLSNGVFGWVAKAMGFNASFWGLAVVAVAGGALYQFRMPETKPQNEDRPDETERMRPPDFNKLLLLSILLAALVISASQLVTVTAERVSDQPLLQDGPAWADLGIFNPAAIKAGNRTVLLVRAQDRNHTSRIGYAESSDGLHFALNPNPLLSPETEYEKGGGLEDPRVLEIDRTYYLTYTGYNLHDAQLCLATSKDLLHWERKGVILPAYKGTWNTQWTKSGAIIGQKINRKWWMYYLGTRTDPDGKPRDYMGLASSADLLHWADATDQPVLDRRPGAFDSRVMEPGPPPYVTDRGILLLYNGADDRLVYGPGWVVFDRHDPRRIIARSDQPFAIPTLPWEKVGNVPNVIFMEGAVLKSTTESHGLQLLGYYGGADKRIGGLNIRIDFPR